MSKIALPISQRQKNIVICGIIAAMAFIPFVSNLLTNWVSVGLTQLVYSRLSFWLEVLLLWAYAYGVERQSFLLWREKKYTINFYLLSFLALFVLQIAARLLAAIPVLLGMHNDMKMVMRTISIVKSHTWAIALTVITAGFTEELIFRGYIQPRLALFFKNKYIPIVITAALFSAMHYRYFSIVEIIFTFCFGLITAAYYEKYRSLGVLIALHIFIDYMAITFAK
jgi:membrane protease YdiL (CAAX protease family)